MTLTNAAEDPTDNFKTSPSVGNNRVSDDVCLNTGGIPVEQNLSCGGIRSKATILINLHEVKGKKERAWWLVRITQMFLVLIM